MDDQGPGPWWFVLTLEGVCLSHFRRRKDALAYLREHDCRPSVSFARLCIRRGWSPAL